MQTDTLFMMKAIAIALLFSPFAAYGSPAQQELIYQMAVAEAASSRVAQTVHRWIRRSPNINAVEKRLLLTYFPDDEMPEMKVRKAVGGTEITIGSLKIGLGGVAKGLLTINGREHRIEQKNGALQLMQEIAGAAGLSRKAAWNFGGFSLIPTAEAAIPAGPMCVGKFEFSWRSPQALLDIPRRYIPSLQTATLALGVTRELTNGLRNCDAQVGAIRKLMREEQIGIRDIQCGTDDAGTDRSIKFWTADRDANGKLKTRKFNLNYALGVAEEEVVEGDVSEDELTPEEREKRPRRIYVFGTKKLQEIRTTSPDSDGENLCQRSGPKDEGFQEAAEDVEPFRKVFEYMGNRDTCNACKKEVDYYLETATPPAYLPGVKPEELKAAKEKGARTKTTELKQSSPYGDLPDRDSFGASAK